jgi:hypothetical protein
MFVGRETLNGTLVLATTHESTNEISLVAYLVITDHESGTFLIQSDETGKVDMLLKTPQRSNRGVFETKWDRRLRVQLTFAPGHTLHHDLATEQTETILFDAHVADIPLFASEQGQDNNDPAIESCGSYMEQMVRKMSEMNEANKQKNPEIWTGLSGSIIGHQESCLMSGKRKMTSFARLRP